MQRRHGKVRRVPPAVLRIVPGRNADPVNFPTVAIGTPALPAAMTKASALIKIAGDQVTALILAKKCAHIIAIKANADTRRFRQFKSSKRQSAITKICAGFDVIAIGSDKIAIPALGLKIDSRCIAVIAIEYFCQKG